MKEAWENYSEPDIIFIVVSFICIIFYTIRKYFHIFSDPLFIFVELERDSYSNICQFISEGNVTWLVLIT